MNPTESLITYTIAEIREARARLDALILKTPVWPWASDRKTRLLGKETVVLKKMEMWQHGGSFKLRGALLHMLGLDEEQKRRGVTAISAGNHAIAVSYAAKIVGTSAKVVMSRHANIAKVNRCKELGAEIVPAEDHFKGFEKVKEVEQEEGRYFVHPFDSPLTTLGTATLGLEFYEQAGSLDAVIIPVGGGGLASGMSMAIKLCNPDCQVYGVEPTGADSLYRSFQSGKPEKLDRLDTIADSLEAPFALPYSFAVCRMYVDEIVLIEDDDMRGSMKILFEDLKLAVEPAAAASLAALLGPLRLKLAGQTVGIVGCGSNIDVETWATHIRNAN